jgi:hypothetical protein
MFVLLSISISLSTKKKPPFSLHKNKPPRYEYHQLQVQQANKQTQEAHFNLPFSQRLNIINLSHPTSQLAHPHPTKTKWGGNTNLFDSLRSQYYRMLFSNINRILNPYSHPAKMFWPFINVRNIDASISIILLQRIESPDPSPQSKLRRTGEKRKTYGSIVRTFPAFNFSLRL